MAAFYTVNAGDVISGITANVSNLNITKEDHKNMSDSNKVYKCERCGQFYTEGEIYQHCKEGAKDREQYSYRVKHQDNGLIGLCPDCLAALGEFMDREKKNREPKTSTNDVDIQKMVIKMMVDKAWEELKKPRTDA